MLNDMVALAFLYVQARLLQWHQWSWFENAFQPVYMLAHVRFGPNKPRAEEMLEQYLAQIVRALALGEEGAA